MRERDQWEGMLRDNTVFRKKRWTLKIHSLRKAHAPLFLTTCAPPHQTEVLKATITRAASLTSLPLHQLTASATQAAAISVREAAT